MNQPLLTNLNHTDQNSNLHQSGGDYVEKNESSPLFFNVKEFKADFRNDASGEFTTMAKKMRKKTPNRS